MLEDYDITEWVEQADDSQREFREVVHTILAAIASDSQLRANMVIKGGIPGSTFTSRFIWSSGDVPALHDLL
jgi:hypothetical protein